MWRQILADVNLSFLRLKPGAPHNNVAGLAPTCETL
jgi:hypothetical protein